MGIKHTFDFKIKIAGKVLKKYESGYTENKNIKYSLISIQQRNKKQVVMRTTKT